MAKITASRLAALALQREGVDTVFYILSAPIVADCIELGMQAILTRNETGAGMMAHGYARATGKPGVVLASHGPGTANIVPSLAKAQADRIRRQESVERQEAQRERGTRPSLPLERYVGAYSHAGLGEVRVAHDGDRLVLQFPGGGGGDLEHWHYDVFRVTWKGTQPIHDLVIFAIDAAGRVGELRIGFPGAPAGYEAVFQRVSGDSPSE